MAATSSSTSFLVFSSLLLFSLFIHQAKPHRLVSDGLSYDFYQSTCPYAESIIEKHLKLAFKKDCGLAAGLLRLHFHDCFVQGCDASVLLAGSASGPTEKQAIPNLTLRAKAFKIIDQLKDALEEKCGGVVSCADIVAIAARDSVSMTGGPVYEVPLGRRDGTTFATIGATSASLPAPIFNATTVLGFFAARGLTAKETVALSGAHTIGIAHCSSFTNRLYPTQDPTMDLQFASELKEICPAADSGATTAIDVQSPCEFDNKYFLDLITQHGLFTSDQDLYTTEITRRYVERFAADEDLFFEEFKLAMVKMGKLGVLSGSQGEIRINCSARNSDYDLLTSAELISDNFAEFR